MSRNCRSFVRVAAATLIGALGMGCSDHVPQRTGAMHLVDDPTARTVRLMRRLDGSGRARFEPVLEMTAPAAYYAYLDNHKYFNQTAIGLAIERNTFQPIASVIARERPISDTQTLAGQYGRHYVDRALIVNITAAGDSTADALIRQEKSRRADGKFVGTRWGFDFYHRATGGSGDAGADLANFAGVAFHQAGNLYANCGELSPGCGVEFFFRGAKVHFVLRRSELNSALAYRNRLISFLERHVIRSGEAAT